MRVLLLGANGQLGHALRQTLPVSADLVCATRDGRLSDGAACERADFDQPASLAPLVARVAPDVVVNAAAYTAVDRAEDDREAAFRVNAEAPGLLARACAQRDALLVHYSTDYVFDGRGSRPYREDDATAPLGVYGASKLAGEEAVRAAGGRHMILRTAWVYGLHGRNFMRTILRLAGERDALRVVDDQTGTPTPAWLVADATSRLLGDPGIGAGLWHVVAGGQATWREFADAIFDQAHARRLIRRRPHVVPIATCDYPTPARRPAYSCLDTTRLRTTTGIALPSWGNALSRTLDDASGLPVRWLDDG
ncbi:dTDP-4-dehydrorhamnose reductase [Luteimonas kalidii]|uniref:dTDP-4-dehydrorhamnose reductase n=1 Tax=Luteimonas kalidii TaxID=3042025 RepID=A0ABT6JXS6_9GAMM|nr:dTDP-4-dehydrorhamnose reductase [Luteimonas kalidii]MDH5835492.1 dTDP-4-dehydrorhamnose reductase [Luteimonas kalidii]